MTDKVKSYFKNPAREENSDAKPYLPEYVQRGFEPIKVGATIVPGGMAIKKMTLPEVRAERQTIHPVPYATAEFAASRSTPFLNVGNNNEQSWVGSNIFDDLTGLDLDHPMIDNNDFVSDEALGLPPAPPTSPGLPDDSDIEKSHQDNKLDLLGIVSDLKQNTFLLIVAGVPICSGPMEEIEEEAYALFIGTHELCDGHPIPMEDIIIIKKVGLKVGLFLNEV
jgi:hypothetical protein